MSVESPAATPNTRSIVAGDGPHTLLLAFYFDPQVTSGVQRARRLYKYLPEYGHSVRVICSSVEGVTNLPGVTYVPGQEANGPRFHAQLARWAHRAAPYNDQFEWLPGALAEASETVKSGNFSAIISTCPPVATHLTALLLKRRFPYLKWIADFRDPIVGNPNRTRRHGRVYDRVLEASIFRRADHVLTVTDAIADRWRSSYPKYASKIHVLWNGFDPENLPAQQPVPVRHQRMLSHIGALYSTRYPNSITDSLERLIRGGKLNPATIQLRQVGPIVGEDQFRARPSVEFLLQCGSLEINSNTVERRVALEQTAASDYLLLLDIAHKDKDAYAVPAKLYDYVPTGRPIVAVTPQNGPVEKIVKKSGLQFQIIYLDDSAEEVDRKMLEMLTAEPRSGDPSSWFKETFDGRKQLAAISKLLGS